MARQSLLRSAEASRRGAADPRRGYDRGKANRISLWVVAIVAAALAVYVAVELGTDPAAVSEGKLRVRALFGFTVDLKDIRSVELEKSPAPTGRRLIGNDAFGLFREGDFEVDGLGTARVFLKRPNLSYLTIVTDDRNYALSLGSLEKDQLLYDRIKQGMR
jgi:hypothetical protein